MKNTELKIKNYIKKYRAKGSDKYVKNTITQFHLFCCVLQRYVEKQKNKGYDCCFTSGDINILEQLIKNKAFKLITACGSANFIKQVETNKIIDDNTAVEPIIQAADNYSTIEKLINCYELLAYIAYHAHLLEKQRAEAVA
jgi:hypothetical protein